MAVSPFDVVLAPAFPSADGLDRQVGLLPTLGPSERLARTVLCEDTLAGRSLAEHVVAWTHGRVGRWVGVAVYPTAQGWVVATLDAHPSRHGRVALHQLTGAGLPAFCAALQDAAQVVLLCDSSHAQEWLSALGADVPVYAHRSFLQVQLYASMEHGVAMLPSAAARRRTLDAWQSSSRRSAAQQALDLVASDLRMLLATGGAQILLH